MEIQLRVILLVIGLLILCGVAIDFFRRRPAKQTGLSTQPYTLNNNELLRTIAGRGHVQHQATYDENYLEDDVIVKTPYRVSPEFQEIENFEEDVILDEPEIYESEPSYDIPAERTQAVESTPPPAPISIDDVIAIHIMSRVRGGFDGDELYKAISNAHFYLGNNNIFYRHENDDGTGEPLFSLVKAVEPGYFDIELLPRQRVPGITLLLLKNKVKDPLLALDKLVRAAKQIGFVLNGELLDHSRQALTLTTIDGYKSKITK